MFGYWQKSLNLTTMCISILFYLFNNTVYFSNSSLSTQMEKICFHALLVGYIARNRCHFSAACRDDEFQCVGSGICIPSNRRCDSFPDCGDMSDESNCSKCTVVVVSHMSHFAWMTHNLVYFTHFRLISKSLSVICFRDFLASYHKI